MESLPFITAQLIQTQSKYREAMSDTWDATRNQTSTGRPIDGIICPVSPLAGYPHDFLPWWGYTCLFNLIDYPSTVLPIKNIKINAIDDPKDLSYKPQDNPFDSANHEICSFPLLSPSPSPFRSPTSLFLVTFLSIEPSHFGKETSS